MPYSTGKSINKTCCRIKLSLNLLDHVEYRLVLPQPYVVIRNGHGLEGDGLGVLEEAVRPPNFSEPLDGQQPVVERHIIGQTQTVVFPALGKEHITGVGLQTLIESHQLHVFI